MSTNLVNKTTGELVTLANGTRMWIGTQSAHDLAVQQGTMPNNCMVCITDDAAGEEAWKYSTSETNTGKKWIDGKPIYRKVASEVLSRASSGWKVTNISMPNADKLLFAQVRLDVPNMIYNFPSIRLENNLIEVYVSPDDISSTQDNFTYILEYTKTTD